MSELINKYELGDMQAIYLLTEGTYPELLLLPADMEYSDDEEKRTKPYSDCLVQVKIKGDTYMGGYAQGRSLRQSPSVLGFSFKEQKVYSYIAPWEKERGDGKDIVTTLVDNRGLILEHHLTYIPGMKSVRSRTVFVNGSEESVSLELLSSFSLGRFSPFMEGDGAGSIKLHRIRSVWSMEGRKETILLDDLQLEPSWGGHAVRCERFGTAGSLPVNGYFPIAVLEDCKNGISLGAQIAHNASWQMEVYRRGSYVELSGGLADREFGHWMKDIKPGECFDTPEAILSVCHTGDGEEIYSRLTSDLMPYFMNGPESEAELPVMFNEFCTTWGNPSHENICRILNAIKGRPFKYFVIDCGWYKEKGVPWDISMGDYQVSADIFPEGMDKTVAAIKDAGMKPGIWFEIDNVGSASRAYKSEDLLLKRDGKPLTTTMRRFWDLRQPEVIDILSERVIGTLKKYGFEYMKIDCNDTVGIGCDGAESLGEGLRQNQAASVGFIRKVKEEIPGILLENCASGGHKLEPLMMSECAMASFSDAHECPEIPLIAANLHRVILPAQSQIWAVIRESDSLKRLSYTLSATFLGRMCISGDVLSLTCEQWQLIDDAIDFYTEAAPIIRDGRTSYYGEVGKNYRDVSGWQGIMRAVTDDGSVAKSSEGESAKTLLVLHGFKGMQGKTVSIPISEGAVIKRVYSYEKNNAPCIEDGMLKYTFTEEFTGVGILL